MRYKKAEKLSSLLKELYPKVETPLNHSNAFELLIAVVMSAQTLDETINKVTPAIFKKYPTPEKLASADVEEIQQMIKKVNYYKTKGKHLVQLSKKLVEEFNSKVPHEMDKLTTLPGVGRKTANVIINEWFVPKGIIEPQGFVVDTHVLRVSKAFGLTEHSDPVKVEKDLMQIFPKEEWREMSLRLIFFGRYILKSRNPEINKYPRFKKLLAK
jgi:endonuclease-3